jgi:hypothetical protein
MKNGNPLLGIGGAPTRATTLPTTAAERKQFPVASGCLDYFPDALCAISSLSFIGNEQHNKGQPLHWARGKSGDEADTMMRHFLQRGTVDTDGVRHSVKMAWRALALLQKELEAEQIASDTVCGSPPTKKQYRYFLLVDRLYRYPESQHPSTIGDYWSRERQEWHPEGSPPARSLSGTNEVTEEAANRFRAGI